MGEQSRLILGLLALVALFAPGCSSADQLKVRDEGVLFPTLRIRHEFERKGEADAPPQGWRGALELEVTGADDATEGKEYRYVQGQLAVRVERAGERFDFALLAGLGYTDVSFKNDTIDFQSTSGQLGGLLGLEGGVRLFPRARLYGRISTLLMPPFSQSDTIEAGISYRVSRAVHVLAGYRRWRYEEESIFIDADLDLRAEGLFLGLGLDF
ncbi:MAG: hypothetical protein V3T86_06480 [Planctomycetota bacterium]